MNGDDQSAFRSHRLNGIFHLRLQEGICPDLERKLAHCQGDGEPVHLTISKASSQPNLVPSPRDEHIFVDDDFLPVVVAWRSTADELLVSEGKYEVARQGGVYEVSPGKLTMGGNILGSYVEHGILRPLVNNVIVPLGSCLAHGAGVRIDGRTLLFLGESGKTSTVLGLLSRGAEYIAEEFVFLDTEGSCSPFTPYMWMDDRHFTLFPELVEPCYPDPRHRRGAAKRIAMYQMAGRIRGDNVVSRQLRQLLISRYYFEGLTCRFDLPFPKARMCERARIDHVFHLDPRGKAEIVVDADADEIARVECASSWIRQGYHYQMASLAGLPIIDQGEMGEVLVQAFRGARCHRLRVRLRAQRDRKALETRVDEVLKVVGAG